MRREHGNRRAWARVERLCRHLVLAPVNARPRISGDFAEDARPASQIAAPSGRVGRESAAGQLPASASAVQPPSRWTPPVLRAQLQHDDLGIAVYARLWVRKQTRS